MQRAVFSGIIYLLFILISFQAPAQAGNKIVLRCADVHNPGYPTVRGVMFMSQLVKERTRGRIEIVVYPNGSLGSEKTVVQMVRLGALEMGRVSVTEVSEVDPDLEVLTLPYIFRDDIHKWKVLEGPRGKGLLDGLARVDLIGLCFQESGYRSFYNIKRPIYRPADLQGLKIRVQPSKTMVELVELLGASAVPIDYNEVYSAFKAGAVDGAENNLPSFLTSGHYKIARYFSFDRHSSIPEVVFISSKIWAGLTAADQAIIRQAARESVAYQRKLWAKYENDSFLTLKREGCHFNEVDLEVFKNEYRSFYQRYNRKYQSLVEGISRVH